MLRRAHNDTLRDRHLPRRIREGRRRQLRLRDGAPARAGRRKAQARDAADVVRTLQHPHHRRLRRHRSLAHRLQQLLRAPQERHSRHLRRRSRIPPRAGRRRRRGRPPLAKGRQHHDGLPARDEPRRPRTAEGRLVRHRRHSEARLRGLRDDTGPRKALREDRRRDDIARRR